MDVFLREHGAKEQIREGYGTTECVTASCLTPRFFFKEGSIGIPFPDTYYKIVIPSTHDEVPYGTVGEICLAGPTVMLGYMDNPRRPPRPCRCTRTAWCGSTPATWGSWTRRASSTSSSG